MAKVIRAEAQALFLGYSRSTSNPEVTRPVFGQLGNFRLADYSPTDDADMYSNRAALAKAQTFGLCNLFVRVLFIWTWK
jgi:hypothetical protein